MADDNRLEGVEIRFVSGALPNDDVRLRGVVGRERLSQLFEFDSAALAEGGPVHRRPARRAPQGALRHHARPPAGRRGPRHPVVDRGPRRDPERRARLPRADGAEGVAARPVAELAHLPEHQRPRHGREDPHGVRHGLGHRLRDHQHERGQEPGSASTSCNTRRATGTSSSAGWSRRGFFYWFSHGKSGEKLIISDDNQPATPIDDPSHIGYRERNNLSSGRVASGLVVQPAPAPHPLAGLRAGLQLPDAEHHALRLRDRGQGAGLRRGELLRRALQGQGTGKAVAKLRAERILCERRVFTGSTTAPASGSATPSSSRTTSRAGTTSST